jgi:CheY-like chemotaxis protein
MSKKTILLVDDDRLIRQGLKAALETQYGYEVMEASNGRNAIAMISSKKPHFDAVVLDIVMPGHGGSVRNYLKKNPEYQDTVIIYYSGLDKNQFDNKILEGAFYINKEEGGMQQVAEILKKLLG